MRDEEARRVRRMPATELRVHLGEALRALDEEEIIIEKGGVPVARLIRYQQQEARGEPREEVDDMYAKAVGKKAEKSGWAASRAAMARGFVGINAEEFVENIYRWRAEGAKPIAAMEPSEDEAVKDDDAGEIPDRQRHLYLPHERKETKRVADEPDEGYRA